MPSSIRLAADPSTPPDRLMKFTVSRSGEVRKLALRNPALPQPFLQKKMLAGLPDAWCSIAAPLVLMTFEGSRSELHHGAQLALYSIGALRHSRDFRGLEHTLRPVLEGWWGTTTDPGDMLRALAHLDLPTKHGDSGHRRMVKVACLLARSAMPWLIYEHVAEIEATFARIETWAGSSTPIRRTLPSAAEALAGKGSLSMGELHHRQERLDAIKTSYRMVFWRVAPMQHPLEWAKHEDMLRRIDTLVVDVCDALTNNVRGTESEEAAARLAAANHTLCALLRSAFPVLPWGKR